MQKQISIDGILEGGLLMKKSSVEVIEFTDPASIWCWGSEPILRKLETHYEGHIKISYVMGGLVKDVKNLHDDVVDEDIKEINDQVARKWLKASKRHGMPVETNSFSLFLDNHSSTYPMNIAYKAAQFQDELLAKRFLRRMREASAVEGKKTNEPEVLIELAQESGLDIEQFVRNFTDGSAENAFLEDLKLVRSYRVHNFPSLVVKNNQGKKIRLRGYQSYAAFRDVIHHLTDGAVSEKKLEGTEKQVLNFIQKFKRVAIAEIEQAFNLSAAKREKMLHKLEEKSLIKFTLVGNSCFITEKK
jgi:predicted DsbA family dithiol-disulfide isomerase